MELKLSKESFLYPFRIFLAFTMKMFFFLCCTVALALSPKSGLAQNADIIIKENRIMNVKQAFKLINKQTDYKFIYRHDLIKDAPKLFLKKGVIKAGALLDKFLRPINFIYTVTKNNTVVVKRESKQLITVAPAPVIKEDVQQNVSGTVTDEKGEPLPGANILEKGTTNGTQSNFDGEFTLTVSDPDAVLEVSYIGFTTKEIPIYGQASIDIFLEESAAGLDEVVVVGYSSQKRATVTGAISTLKAEEVADIPLPNVSQTLAGRVAGLNMRPNGGAPGSDNPDINIRGIVTTGNSSPLVVVDGIRRNNIQQIDPNTIETVTVLKDAAAVAPFGIGGANGVILITTKRGQLGKPNISINSTVGFQKPTYLPDMVNAQDYLRIRNEGYFNDDPDGTTPPVEPSLIENYPSLHAQDPFLYPDSNFVEVYRKNAPVYSNNMEISGGTELIKYRGSLGYFKQEGIFEPVGYQRYNYNLALDAQVTPTTKISMSLFGSIEDTDGIDGDENLPHLFRSFYKFIPTQTLVYPGGDKWGESSGGTPLGVLNSEGYRKDEDNTLLSAIAIEQQLPFIQGLSIKGVFSYDPSTRYYKSFHVPFVYQNIDLSSQPYTFTDVLSAHEGSGELFTWLELENRRAKTFTYQGYINYNRSFGNHNVTALFVAEATRRKNDFFRTRRERFTINIDELDLGSSDLLDSRNNGSSGTASELGYVYRIGYNFKNKYIVEASGRYDGHYSFGPDNRWGYFPAFSAAWRISEEKFMENMDNIDNLKLRGSWGRSGNLPSGGSFQYLDGYDLRGNAYAFGPGNVVQGSSIGSESNPNITWEIATKLDLGFDLTMWNGLLNLEFDYFQEDRTGMLIAPQVTVPVEYGLSLSQENKGAMKNRGFEFTLGTSKRFENGLQMNINANFSYAKNEMVEDFQTDAERANPNRNRIGKPYQTPFGYKSLGLFSTADDINNDGIIDAADNYNVQQFGELHPGDIRYADLSGPDGVPDGIIDVNDQTAIGNPTYPGITYGLNTAFTYKGFDLSLFFQGASHSSLNLRTFLTVPFNNNGSNFSYEYFNNRWTADTQDAKYPRATTAPYSNNTQNSDFWMEDTSYLRLKTAIIGYTLPREVTSKFSVASIRFNLVAQNLFTFSGLDFVDPELGYSSRENSYPVSKSVSFGVNVSL
jgi:TonB-linked SusC/RagA family outer membrane protein